MTYLMRLLWGASLLMLISACAREGSDMPHPAVLYNVCDVADSSPSLPVFHLYQPDSDNPVVLRGAVMPEDAAKLPDAGKSLVLAYIPAGGVPYVNDDVEVISWGNINNLKVVIPEDEDDGSASEDGSDGGSASDSGSSDSGSGSSAGDILQGWDADPVNLMACWRGGHKIYMRLKLQYSADPRRFALIVDPETADTPNPELYLYHSRPVDNPSFDRQYYAAFDISPLWEDEAVSTVTVHIATSEYSTVKNPAKFVFSK